AQKSRNRFFVSLPLLGGESLVVTDYKDILTGDKRIFSNGAAGETLSPEILRRSFDDDLTLHVVVMRSADDVAFYFVFAFLWGRKCDDCRLAGLDRFVNTEVRNVEPVLNVGCRDFQGDRLAVLYTDFPWINAVFLHGHFQCHWLWL